MWRSHLKVAIRHLLREKGHSFIKIFGLSLGIGSCLLIYLFVADELSFDKFHVKGNALFRLIQIQFDRTSGNETGYQESMPAPMGPELGRTVPEILRQTRFAAGQGIVQAGDKIFTETLTLVDPDFLEMFTFPLVAGDPRGALSDDYGLVLTRSSATKYFGTENPLGRTLTVTTGQSRRGFIVTGIASDPPRNSMLRFDILIPFNNLPAVTNDSRILNDWARWYCPLFVLLRPNTAPDRVLPALDLFCRQYFGPTLERYRREGHDAFRFGLQSITTLRTDTRFAGAVGLSTSTLLSAIGLAILLIACVNFMNLSLGSSSARSMDVGIRKVLGARRGQLLRQFAGETIGASLFAGVLALGLTELILPAFNAMSGKQLSLTTFFSGVHGLALTAIIVFTGLLAGSYPAAVMTSFPAAEIMRKKLKIGGKTTLTQGLVVVQFALSVILGISAAVLSRQVNFMLNKDPGYDSKGLVVVLTQDNDPLESERTYQRFRNEILPHARIEGLTASNREFGFFLPSSTLEWEARQVRFRFNRVDPDFLTTMKLRLKEGRDFSRNAGADRDAIIINERLVRALGPAVRLGEYLGDPSRGFPYDRRVIGVVRDCHFSPLLSEIEPMILFAGENPSPQRNTYGRMIVRVKTDQIKESLAVLESAWKKIRPDKPFLSYTQDDALQGLYQRERRWKEIVRSASLLSLMLAGLGILGLTSVTLSRRVKEFGIRKVLGAGPGRIMIMTIREFILLISIGNALAWPVAYIVMRNFLKNYPYRIAVTPVYFLASWAASILLAVLATSVLTGRAAFRNPIDSLRDE